MTYIGCSTPHVVTKAMKALRACADLLERSPDVAKLRGLVERMNNLSSDPCATAGWRAASRHCRDELAALLPNTQIQRAP